MGPADEFQIPLGYDEAPVGGTFIKIGVGVLRKAGNARYSAFSKYELVDPGKWSARTGADFVEFTQELSDPATGYGYVYRKTVRLAAAPRPPAPSGQMSAIRKPCRQDTCSPARDRDATRVRRS